MRLGRGTEAVAGRVEIGRRSGAGGDVGDKWRIARRRHRSRMDGPVDSDEELDVARGVAHVGSWQGRVSLFRRCGVLLSTRPASLSPPPPSHAPSAPRPTRHLLPHLELGRAEEKEKLELPSVRPFVRPSETRGELSPSCLDGAPRAGDSETRRTAPIRFDFPASSTRLSQLARMHDEST
jgi:hypothetical protein